MKHLLTTPRIDEMRAASRHIVRELGFMQRGLAGTELSPSAVHTVIELGYGTVRNASDLAALLHLEKSSVSRLIQKLESDGLIEVGPDPSDKRTRVLSLTQDGQNLLGEVERFARRQLRSALDLLSATDVAQIESGLTLFAKSLRAKGERVADVVPEVDVQEGYCSGVIAAVAHLHAAVLHRST